MATTKTADSSKELIYELLPKVVADIHAVPKSQRNAFQKFNFRGIDDVYPVIRPALAKHGCAIVPYAESVDIDRQVLRSKKGEDQSWCKVIVLMRYTIYAPDGSNVVARFYGEGNDTSDKAIAKAHSNAYKKFAFDTFCIPTGEPDPDHDDVKNPTPQPKVDPNDPARAISGAEAARLTNLIEEKRKAAGFTSGSALDVAKAIRKDVLGDERCQTLKHLTMLCDAVESGKYDLDTGELINV